MLQGLHPLAESLGPFGTKKRTPVHAIESRSIIEDDDEYRHGVSPGLEQGLASATA
jgi:hypothetical protein